jgi:hypothetical protein
VSTTYPGESYGSALLALLTDPNDHTCHNYVQHPSLFLNHLLTAFTNWHIENPGVHVDPNHPDEPPVNNEPNPDATAKQVKQEALYMLKHFADF